MQKKIRNIWNEYEIWLKSSLLGKYEAYLPWHYFVIRSKIGILIRNYYSSYFEKLINNKQKSTSMFHLNGANIWTVFISLSIQTSHSSTFAIIWKLNLRLNFQKNIYIYRIVSSFENEKVRTDVNGQNYNFSSFPNCFDTFSKQELTIWIQKSVW